MSTWISRTAAAALAAAAAFGLAGCGDVGGGPGFLSRISAAQPEPARAVTELRAGDGTLRIVAPPGFCFDGTVTQESGGSIFAVAASCAALSTEMPGPFLPALLKVTLSPPGEGFDPRAGGDALASFLRTEAGRGLLARSGAAADVEILSVERRTAGVYVLLTDSGAGAPPGVEEAYWRGFVQVAGRLATLSVYSMEAAPLPTRMAGLSLITDFAAALIEANPPPPAPAETVSARNAPPLPAPAGLR